MSWSLLNLFKRPARVPVEASNRLNEEHSSKGLHRSSSRRSIRRFFQARRESCDEPEKLSDGDLHRSSSRHSTRSSKRKAEPVQEVQVLRPSQTDELAQRLEKLSSENNTLRFELQKKDKELQKWKFQKSICCRCEQLALEHRQTMLEMEAFYKDKLTESRSALKEKEEQLRSFKDRVAQNVMQSLKTDNTENMNNPVNQSRLTEMYQQFRVCIWPNIQLTCSDTQARALVKKTFAEAAKQMENLRTSMKKVCGFIMSPNVEKLRQTALENLQLALYHSNKEDVFKVAFPQFRRSPDQFQLASECYWLGCLMELNTPPLHPHWNKADRESVFPRDIRPERRHVNTATHV